MGLEVYCECDIDFEGHQPHCLVGAVYEVAHELKLLHIEGIKDLKDKVDTNLGNIGITLDNIVT